jgi:glycine oxidase
VAGLTVHDDRATGVTLLDGGRIECDTVVVAAGWRSGDLAGLPAGAGLPVRPVKGQILRLRKTAGARLPGRVVRTAEVYIVPREGGELVVGATVEERGDTAVTAGGVLDLLRAAYEVLPGVTELELVEATAGLRPGTPDNRAFVGPDRLAGLVWATGHWRNGILLAPLTADAVVAVIAEGELPERLRAISPDRYAHRAPVTGALGS